MSREIDERIVEMRFDNQQFEAGVQTSLCFCGFISPYQCWVGECYIVARLRVFFLAMYIRHC